MFAQESVMDIQEEREAFEAYMAEKYKSLMDRRQCLNNGGGYMAWDMNVAWQVWQAAKAQAVPEGFVLVDKHQLAQLMANMDSFGKKALGDDYVSFADIAAVLDEAQEPTND